MERGNDVRAVREIEGWEDKQAEGRRENERQCVLKKYLPVFFCSVMVLKHILSVDAFGSR